MAERSAGDGRTATGDPLRIGANGHGTYGTVATYGARDRLAKQVGQALAKQPGAEGEGLAEVRGLRLAVGVLEVLWDVVDGMAGGEEGGT